MNTELVLSSIADGIQTVRINRADKKNAMTQDMYAALERAFLSGADDPQVRVAVLCGAGNTFCSGNDLQDFLAMPAERDENVPVFRMMRALLHFPKPVVAAVNGVAIGIGTTILQHCDLVYAAQDTRFQMPFVNLGIRAEFGATYLMPRMMGYQRAAELILTGDAFTAEKARECGLVNEVLPAADVEPRAFERARKIAAQPPNATRVNKALMRRWNQDAVLEAIRVEGSHFVPMLKQPEALEAVTAFMQKRKPDFSRFS